MAAAAITTDVAVLSVGDPVRAENPFNSLPDELLQ
jgi:hypothetical protein